MVYRKRDSCQHILLSRPGFAQKACEVPKVADTAAQKQEVVQIPLWEIEYYSAAGLFRIFWYKVWILRLLPDKINIIKMKEGTP